MYQHKSATQKGQFTARATWHRMVRTHNAREETQQVEIPHSRPGRPQRTSASDFSKKEEIRKFGAADATAALLAPGSPPAAAASPESGLRPASGVAEETLLARSPNPLMSVAAPVGEGKSTSPPPTQPLPRELRRRPASLPPDTLTAADSACTVRFCCRSSRDCRCNSGS